MTPEMTASGPGISLHGVAGIEFTHGDMSHSLSLCNLISQSSHGAQMNISLDLSPASFSS